jgi:hypothetical protein
MVMGVVDRLRRWYVLTFGRGKRMLEHGAEVEPCPHCGDETPVYRSSYDRWLDPVTFSVCLWCDGLIEYDDRAVSPRPPFTSPGEVHAREQSRPRVRRRRRVRQPTGVSTSTSLHQARGRNAYLQQGYTMQYPHVQF